MKKRIRIGNRIDARALKNYIWERYGFYTYWGEETRRCTACGRFSNAPQTSCDHDGRFWEPHRGRVFAIQQATPPPISGPGHCIFVGTAFEVYREFVEKDGAWWSLTLDIKNLNRWRDELRKHSMDLPMEAAQRLCSLLDEREQKFPERIVAAIFGPDFVSSPEGQGATL
jgi:hypothetical protein